MPPAMFPDDVATNRSKFQMKQMFVFRDIVPKHAPGKTRAPL